LFGLGESGFGVVVQVLLVAGLAEQAEVEALWGGADVLVGLLVECADIGLHLLLSYMRLVVCSFQ
jgi:hypothetical protein